MRSGVVGGGMRMCDHQNLGRCFYFILFELPLSDEPTRSHSHTHTHARVRGRARHGLHMEHLEDRRYAQI